MNKYMEIPEIWYSQKTQAYLEEAKQTEMELRREYEAYIWD